MSHPSQIIRQPQSVIHLFLATGRKVAGTPHSKAACHYYSPGDDPDRFTLQPQELEITQPVFVKNANSHE